MVEIVNNIFYDLRLVFITADLPIVLEMFNLLSASGDRIFPGGTPILDLTGMLVVPFRS